MRACSPASHCLKSFYCRYLLLQPSEFNSLEFALFSAAINEFIVSYVIGDTPSHARQSDSLFKLREAFNASFEEEPIFIQISTSVGFLKDSTSFFVMNLQR